MKKAFVLLVLVAAVVAAFGQAIQRNRYTTGTDNPPIIVGNAVSTNPSTGQLTISQGTSIFSPATFTTNASSAVDLRAIPFNVVPAVAQGLGPIISFNETNACCPYYAGENIYTDIGGTLYFWYPGTTAPFSIGQTITLSGVPSPLTSANGTWTILASQYYGNNPPNIGFYFAVANGISPNASGTPYGIVSYAANNGAGLTNVGKWSPQIFYVDNNVGSDSAQGTNLQSPFLTINHALNVGYALSTNPFTVVVEPSLMVYPVATNTWLSNGVVIVGSLPAMCVLSCYQTNDYNNPYTAGVSMFYSGASSPFTNTLKNLTLQTNILNRVFTPIITPVIGNILVDSCWGNGDSDFFYTPSSQITGAGPWTLTVNNCDINSGWDIAAFQGPESNTVTHLINSRFAVTWDNAFNPQSQPINGLAFVQLSGTNYYTVDNCQFTATVNSGGSPASVRAEVLGASSSGALTVITNNDFVNRFFVTNTIGVNPISKIQNTVKINLSIQGVYDPTNLFAIVGTNQTVNWPNFEGGNITASGVFAGNANSLTNVRGTNIVYTAPLPTNFFFAFDTAYSNSTSAYENYVFTFASEGTGVAEQNSLYLFAPGSTVACQTNAVAIIKGTPVNDTWMMTMLVPPAYSVSVTNFDSGVSSNYIASYLPIQ